MTATETLPSLDEQTDTEGELTHYVCCLNLVGQGLPSEPALCGAQCDMTRGLSQHADLATVCAVCHDLAGSMTCPRSRRVCRHGYQPSQ